MQNRGGGGGTCWRGVLKGETELKVSEGDKTKDRKITTSRARGPPENTPEGGCRPWGLGRGVKIVLLKKSIGGNLGEIDIIVY